MFKNKKKGRGTIYSRVWLIVITVIVISILISAISLFVKRERVWKKVDVLRKEKEVLSLRKEHIQSKMDEIEKGIGQEAIFREKFNVVKRGEEVIIFTEPKMTEEDIVEKKGIWATLKKILHIDQ